MKSVCFCVLLFLQAAAFGRDSAYQALRLIGNQKGRELLNHVIEVQGKGGAPQPAVWRVIVDDPTARGGIREFEVSKGKIISEHTPLRGYSGVGTSAVMDFQKLYLDSEGAFSVANQEATKAKMGFDSIDFELRTGDDQAAPVWILQLFDATAGNVGSIQVAADTGKVVSRDLGGKGRHIASAPYPDERHYADGPPPLPPPDAPDDEQPHQHYGVGHEIDKEAHRIGASLQQFFTGKRTLDERFQDED